MIIAVAKAIADDRRVMVLPPSPDEPGCFNFPNRLPRLRVHGPHGEPRTAEVGSWAQRARQNQTSLSTCEWMVRTGCDAMRVTSNTSATPGDHHRVRPVARSLWALTWMRVQSPRASSGIRS